MTDRAAYASFFRLRFLHGLQYRVAALAGLVTQFAFGFLFLTVFLAFHQARPGATDLSTAQLANYVWLTQAFLVLVALWFRDSDLLNTIVSGHLVYEYCRPWDLYGAWFARLAAHRLAAVALRALPILLLAGFLPAPYALTPPPSLEALGAFVLTLVGGFAVMVALSELLTIGTILTQSPLALFLLVGTLGDFCSGLVVPLPFLPPEVQALVAWLPFHLTADLPFRAWSGHLSGAEVGAGLAAQAVWFGVLVVGGRWALARIGRRLVVQGG